ncbi:hypothetical protein PsexTeo8_16720 [Pseudomonas extremaustralis]|uniref:hypothetical protein n=1 Tax=Pseudomonas extremaustralis TaxID=359110 RepID=UPI002AA0DC13|nr:hypothetical protein [Pseudomonas extremaustralis]MDY7065244.1 hypothetical protein [Pseudomonas extremaustralis]
MRGVKRIALVLFALLVVLTVFAFVLENQQGIILSFLGWNTAQLPASVFIILALIIGMLIGPVLWVLVRPAARRKQSS